MNCFSFFLDVSGRVAEGTQGQTSVTAAAIAIANDRVEAVRSMLPHSLPKWGNSSPEDCRTAVRIILDNCIAALAFRVIKQEPDWSRFWSDSDSYCQLLKKEEPRRSKEANSFKAPNVLKYWLFGEPAARLAGECVCREGAPRILDHQGRGIVDISIIGDADIQGGYNVDMFKSLWSNLNTGNMFPGTGLVHHTRSVDLKSEQEEPLLMLPDHLAGLVQTRFGAPEVPLPSQFDQAALEGLYNKLMTSPKFVHVNYTFDLRYSDMFRGTRLGQELWPSP